MTGEDPKPKTHESWDEMFLNSSKVSISIVLLKTEYDLNDLNGLFKV